MRLVTAEQMRELDRRTIQEYGTPGETLMERAGKGVADILRRLIEIAGFIHPTIRLIAGRGNNGGDAFVAARCLKEMSFHPQVWISGEVNQVKGDALKHLSRMKAAHVSLLELPTMEDWDEVLEEMDAPDILVGRGLGNGKQGPGPRPGCRGYSIYQRSIRRCAGARH